jgi:MIP family channel proteins
MQPFDFSKRVRAYFAELVGTTVFLFLSTTAASTAGSNTLTIATAFGIGLATAIFIARPVSGGHINPAVSFAMVLSGNLDIIDGVGYIVSQLAGAVAGSAIGYGVLGSEKYGGWLSVAPGLSQRQGFVAEIVGTFVLVTIVFIVCVQTTSGLLTPSKLTVRGMAPQIIGFATWVIHLALIPINGCGVNPARAFGPALVNNKFNDHWIYWAGPAVGALCVISVQFILFGSAKALEVSEEDELMQTRKVTESRVVV